jgi:NADH dehydrogenase [ubiquinone] 1 alpha subcomplex assembly factor 7
VSAEQGFLPERLARAITLAGPIPLSQFMGAANAEYYASAPSVGAAGDFITSPEISQMFGELIGFCLADAWDRAGRPDCRFVEFGPGRGTLAADALRAMATTGMRPDVHFVETSPRLRDAQAVRVPDAVWHDDLASVPTGKPLLCVANEFFDALPIEQIIYTGEGWRQRMVACQDTLFLPVVGKPVPDAIVPEKWRNSEVGSVIESSPAGAKMMRAVAKRLKSDGGAAIIIDYGYEGPAIGETLQAVRGHKFANPFDAPGTQDLSAHVDFSMLYAAAISEGCAVQGPVSQRDFLGQLGIAQRAAALAKGKSDAEGDAIAASVQRLIGSDQMGVLFQVLGVRGDEFPDMAGFQ